MFKQLFKITFISFVWTRYKSVIISTLLLFVFFWLVHKVHADFLAYSKLQNTSENLGLSFVLKWAVMIGGIVLYFVYNSWVVRKRRSKKKVKKLKEVKQKMNAKNDPFAEIRKKDKLVSKTDFILNNKPSQKNAD